VSFPCAQINHRSDQALCLLQRVPLSAPQRSLQKSRAPQRPATERTLPLLTPFCSTLDHLHRSKDTAQLFAENRHMRTVNRLLVRVASRHRAKAAACRRARGERRRRRSFSCISGVNHVRQSWEYLCGVRAYMPGVVAVMGGDGRRCTLRRADAAAGRQSGGGAASLTHGP
jgi:hypothetical protein